MTTTSGSDQIGSARLAGRRIVVTGAASGMGEATARLFAREGAKLSLLDISGEAVAALARELNCVSHRVDVMDEAEVGAAIEASAAELGGLDGVVNAAGILVSKPIEETDLSTFHRIVGVNLQGPFLICKAALPHLRKEARATIVNVASLAGLRGYAGLGIYASSKGGLVRFSEALASEVGPTVRVNVICPGLIRTPMTGHMLNGNTEARLASSLPLGRIGELIDVANTALFLTSEELAFITGVTLRVDGGRFE